MSRLTHRLLLRAYAMALCCASWIVPDDEREEWLKEWRGELWHVVNQNLASSAPHATAAFVSGAFRDAYLLSADLRRAGARRSYAFGSSPVWCLFFLLLLGFAAAGLAFLLPGTRAALLPAPYQDARTLVIVTRDGSSHSLLPGITLGEFRYWKRAAQSVFSDVAFYQVVRRQIHAGHGTTIELSIARASDNLLDVLQTSAFPAAVSARSAKNMPKLILSDAVWRKYFHADPQITGRVVFLLGEKATVVGVAKPDAWPLPGKADAWLLEDASRLETLSADSIGFVIARVQSSLTRDESQGQ